MKQIHLLLVCTWRHDGGQVQKYVYPLGTKLCSNVNSLKYFSCIHHFHGDHNAPYLPPNFVITIVFNFSLAFSRPLDSFLLAEAGTKVKREETGERKGLFPPPPPLPTSRDYIFTCLTFTRHPHYLRAWNRLLSLTSTVIPGEIGYNGCVKFGGRGGKQGVIASRWKWTYFVTVLETGSVLSRIALALWDCMFPAQTRANQ